MSFRPSEFPGGYERHCLRRINHAYLFADVLYVQHKLLVDSPDRLSDELLAEAIARDTADAAAFSNDFEAILERAVALKPSEETEVVLAVKAELDRLYTVSASVCGEQSKIQEALARLIDLTMQSVKRAAGDDALAVKELQEETDARSLHFKQLECLLLADLLNSDSVAEAFIPSDELIPTLMSSEKAVLVDVVGLFDLPQVIEITRQSGQLLETLQADLSTEGESAVISNATENLEFIKGYKIYLEDYG